MIYLKCKKYRTYFRWLNPFYVLRNERISLSRMLMWVNWCRKWEEKSKLFYFQWMIFFILLMQLNPVNFFGTEHSKRYCIVICCLCITCFCRLQFYILLFYLTILYFVVLLNAKATIFLSLYIHKNKMYYHYGCNWSCVSFLLFCILRNRSCSAW